MHLSEPDFEMSIQLGEGCGTNTTFFLIKMLRPNTDILGEVVSLFKGPLFDPHPHPSIFVKNGEIFVPVEASSNILFKIKTFSCRFL